MARLGMLYAITDEELAQLKAQKIEERYEYMVDEIQAELFATEDCWELDMAWEGIQFCLGEGTWKEGNKVPYNIIFGGEIICDYNNEIISLKKAKDIKEIVDYLEINNLQEIIKNNFEDIREDEYSLPKDEDELNYLLDWSKGILEFYQHALDNQLNVIFTVDL
ncbi:MAG: DUF1877 family protein [Capnocytophaga sp.]|nr:DUF1877 family protein [Capnocytophaga sp.]